MATKDEDAITHLFVTSTHTPVLFFSTAGKVYRMKVWRLPEGRPRDARAADDQPAAARPGETISNVLPLPEDEITWGDLHVMFATAKGVGAPQLDGCVRQHPHLRQDRDAVRGRIGRPPDRRLAAHRG
jgi:DNA gyrase/topoisomerase IV subunit A